MIGLLSDKQRWTQVLHLRFRLEMDEYATDLREPEYCGYSGRRRYQYWELRNPCKLVLGGVVCLPAVGRDTE